MHLKLVIVASALTLATASAATDRAAPAASLKGTIATTPLGNPGDWVGTNDYPASALRNHEAGTVGFRLTTDAAGLVTQCQVTVSSGSAVLDQATCTLIQQRARFAPALDRRGRAMEGSYTNRVRWVLPKDAEAVKPGELVHDFIVEKDGSRSHCHIEKATGVAATQMNADFCMEPFSVLPFVDQSGAAVRKKVIIRQSLTIEDLP